MKTSDLPSATRFLNEQRQTSFNRSIKRLFSRLLFSFLTVLGFASTSAAAVFTSVTSGNLTDGATWGNQSPGVAGVDFPNASGEFITISSNHTITVTQNYSLKSINLESSSTLDIGVYTITITQALTLNGVINGSGLLKLSAANVPLYGSGTISSSFELDGNCTLATGSNIQLTASDLTIGTSSIFMNRGTLIVSNSIVGNDASSEFQNQDGSALHVGGELLTTGTLSALGTGNLVQYTGTSQTVKTTDQSILYDLVLSGSGEKYLETSFTVKGDLSLENQSSMKLDSNLTVILEGNLHIASLAITPINFQNSCLTLSGTSLQTISGGTSFADLTLNNSAGAELTSGSYDLTGTLTISDGNLETNNSLTLLSNSDGTARIAAISGSVSGDLTVQRFVDSNVTGWRNISTPVHGSLVSDLQDDIILTGFPGSDFPNFPFVNVVAYDETVTGISDNGYYYPTSSSDSMVSGQGFWIYFTPTTLDWTGSVNSDTAVIPVTYTNTGDAENDGWNFVGNPFASAFSWEEATLTNMTDQYWMYDPIAGNYAVWNQTTQSGTLGANGKIASGQGFMVHAVGSSPQLDLPQAAKVSNQGVSFKSSGNMTPEITFRLTSNQSTYYDDAILRFDSAASNDFDFQYDVTKIFSGTPTAPGIATQSSDSFDLALNSMGQLAQDVVIPLHIQSSLAADLTIDVWDLQGFDDYNCIMLEDQLTGTWVDLKTTNSYTFNFTELASSDRLFLHLTSRVQLEGSNPTCSGIGDGYIAAHGTGTPPYNFMWQDLQGNVLGVEFNVPSSDTLNWLSSGTFVVTAQSANSFCHTSYDTITLVSPSPIIITNTTTDATCFGESDGTVQLAVSGGTGPLSVIWNDGQFGQNIGNLTSGTYEATVSDSTGCSFVYLVQIQEPAEVVANFSTNASTFNLQQNPIVDFTNTSQGATTYFWNFGNGNSSTDVNPEEQYTEAGTYLVDMIATNGPCVDQVQSIVIIEGESDEDGSLVSLNEQNPSTEWDYSLTDNQLRVEWGSNAQISAIKLFDSSGQLLAQHFTPRDSHSAKFELSNHSSGVYFLTVEGVTTSTRKLLYLGQ
jgi:PKD repeat protein